MSTLEQHHTAIPTGTWRADPVHSSVGFAVTHNLVSTFRGEFTDVGATLSVDGEIGLEGTVPVASVSVKDENLNSHLLSPEFFDAERHPELRFRSIGVRAEGARVAIDGELTVKGITRPVEIRGRASGPVTDAYGKERIALELETVVDRSEFDLRWNAPLPGGGFLLGDDVTLTAELELVKEA